MWEKIKGLFAPNDYSHNRSTVILVVDDGQVERSFMEKTLKKRCYTVLTASNGEDGVTLAREKQPDLIFLDYSMPKLNGKETCRILKANEETKNIPIVFLTGSITPGKVIECYDVGAEDYLAKPITSTALLEHTRLLLEDLNLNKPKVSAEK